MSAKKDWKKDAWISIGVALIAIVLYTLTMASMARVGQSAGENFRGRAVHGMQKGALDSAPFDSSALDTLPLFGTAQPGPAGGVPVLCYHYLRRSPGVIRLAKVMLHVVLSLPVLDDNELWTLSEGAFDNQMRWLYENGYRSITLDQLTRWQYGHEALPPKCVVITFDDGDRSVYDYAWPILEKYGFTASYFIITREVGLQWRGLDFLSWDELREMSQSGTFTIESHTHSLHYKVGEKDAAKPVFLAAHDGQYAFDGFDRWQDRVVDDLQRSRRIIALKVGRTPHYLAWPYGHSEPDLDLMAHDVGYDRTVLLEAGTNESFVPTGDDTIPLVDRVTIRRYAVSARTSMHSFVKMVRGTYLPPDAY